MTNDNAHDQNPIIIRRDPGAPSFRGELRRIEVTPRTVFIDRYEGTTRIDQIWQGEPNQQVIIARTADSVVREACAKWFRGRSIEPVIKSLLTVKTIKAGTVPFTRKDLYAAIRNNSGVDLTDSMATVIMEIVSPFLTKLGLVGGSGKYTMRTSYGFKKVTVVDIAHDASMQEVLRVLKDAKTLDISGKTYTPSVLAEEIAECLMPVGLAFTDFNELLLVIEDLVRGVRGHIDPNAHDSGLTGTVDPSWRDHSVVVELASNVTFIEAALSLTGSITPKLDAWKLDKWAPAVMAAMKVSARYGLVGRAEFCRSWNLTKIRDLRGQVRATIVHRTAKPAAVAMSVYAFPDATMANTTILSPTKERIAEAIVSAYNGGEAMSISAGVRVFAELLLHAVEAGYNPNGDAYIVDVADLDNDLSGDQARLIPVMRADRVIYQIDDDGSLTRFISVKTEERKVAASWAMTGRYDGGSFLTSDLAEAYMMMDEFASTGAVDERAQMLSAEAMNSRLIGFDTDVELVELKTRISYSCMMTGVEKPITGAFKANDLGSMRASASTSLVKPKFNEAVLRGLEMALGHSRDLLDRLGKIEPGDDGAVPVMPEALRRQLQRMFAHGVLRVAQGLAPGFRDEVQRGMIERSVGGLTFDASLALRSRMNQNNFAGYADVFSLVLFLTMQGLDERNVWASLAKDPDLTQVYFEYGSDRKDK